MRTLLLDHKEYEEQFSRLHKEKDRQRDDAREQFEARVKLEKHLFKFQKETRDKVFDLNHRIS